MIANIDPSIIITWATIAGILQSDGSITFGFRFEGTFDPKFIITQSGKSEVWLNTVRSFLQQNGINVQKPRVKPGRSINLYIRGIKNCKKFMEYLDALMENGRPIFMENKLRDYLLLKEVYEVHRIKEQVKNIRPKGRMTLKIENKARRKLLDLKITLQQLRKVSPNQKTTSLPALEKRLGLKKKTNKQKSCPRRHKLCRFYLFASFRGKVPKKSTICPLCSLWWRQRNHRKRVFKGKQPRFLCTKNKPKKIVQLHKVTLWANPILVEINKKIDRINSKLLLDIQNKSLPITPNLCQFISACFAGDGSSQVNTITHINQPGRPIFEFKCQLNITDKLLGKEQLNITDKLLRKERENTLYYLISYVFGKRSVQTNLVEKEVDADRYKIEDTSILTGSVKDFFEKYPLTIPYKKKRFELMQHALTLIPFQHSDYDKALELLDLVYNNPDYFDGNLRERTRDEYLTLINIHFNKINQT
jgi:hypothetical protein